MNGAELGKEICDSFKQGCKQAGTDAEITLSVTDLSKTPAIIEALQNMGKVVLKKAEKDSSVCANLPEVPRRQKIMVVTMIKKVTQTWLT